MSPNKRIVLNIVATYGRSLFALVCGLFTSRWVLMALGQQDYGLYGVVGGMTAFIVFLNGLMGAAVSRFYAISVGEAIKTRHSQESLEECRRWFNVAVTIHTVIPLVLVTIGYPVGEWMVRHFLSIPVDRIEACVLVFRFACLTCFVGMVNCPFVAMYNAKQYIAELTLFQGAQTLLNFFFLYFMVTHPRDWLAAYGAGMCLIAVVPQVVTCIRALVVFPECHFRKEYLWSWTRFKALGAFGFWQIFGGVGYLLRGQGIAILVNKLFGPVVNAAMAIANNVSGQTATLSVAMQTAFQPAIVTMYGAGDVEGARRMAFRACKFGLLLSLIFVLPLMLELNEVMRIWLKTPPRYAGGLCVCMMLILLIDKCTLGQMILVNARGKVALYQAVVGGAVILALPIAFCFAKLGGGPYSVGVAMVISMGMSSLARVFFAQRLVGMPMGTWFSGVILPAMILIVCAGGVALIPRIWMPASFLRIGLTTILVEIVFASLAWNFVLDVRERAVLTSRIVAGLKSIGVH